MAYGNYHFLAYAIFKPISFGGGQDPSSNPEQSCLCFNSR